jgi:hypothetical protein
LDLEAPAAGVCVREGGNLKRGEGGREGGTSVAAAVRERERLVHRRTAAVFARRCAGGCVRRGSAHQRGRLVARAAAQECLPLSLAARGRAMSMSTHSQCTPVTSRICYATLHTCYITPQPCQGQGQGVRYVTGAGTSQQVAAGKVRETMRREGESEREGRRGGGRETN